MTAKSLIALAFLLALPATAAAGGWATVGVADLPAGTPPGGTWTAKLTILQHGRTPLEHVEPFVIVKSANGKTTRFAATPAGEPGVYVAKVKFPAAGRYEYLVDDGFGNMGREGHTYPPVQIGGVAAPASAPAAPPAPAPDGGVNWLGALLAAGLLAALALVLRRHPLKKEPAAPEAGPATAPLSSSEAISSSP
jgi:hypothetical protein